MPAFVVKHIASRRGPLVDRRPIYERAPYSYTSKEQQSHEAAKGNPVYVIEVRRTAGKTTYWLGFKYVARRRLQQPAGGKWDDQFKYKLIAAPGRAVEGVYFDAPIPITDHHFVTWFLLQRYGMVELPARLVFCLEDLFILASAKKCA